LTDKGQPWLTDKHLDELHDQIIHQPGFSLLEANEAVLKLLYRTQVDVNEVTAWSGTGVRRSSTRTSLHWASSESK
jgi:type I restriction enzyme R subunit